MPADPDAGAGAVSAEWVLGRLRGEGGPGAESDTVLIDCRGAAEYAAAHIRSAVNLSIPSIMLRRLAAGKIDLCATVQCAELRARLQRARAAGCLVLYGAPAAPAAAAAASADSVHAVLLRRLRQDGVRVVTLEGDFAEFRRAYPEWCSEVGAHHTVPHLPLMGLRSLRISGSGYDERGLSSGSSSECEDGHGHHHQQDFPIEILPNLYLGNSSNSEDCDALARHNIKYVLNVTPDLPNTFEAEGGDISYLKIPIADHWSQNLAVHFPQAIRFIEEAMSAKCGVLVHCVAGVSRSVTVTLAYLMQRHRLNLKDAFELVRSRKTDVAPNFHFMRQLHTFEQDLGLHQQSASLSKVLEEVGVQDLKRTPDSGFLTENERVLRGRPRGVAPCGCAPTSLGVSPDSGIEFDRWSAARDTPQ